MTDMPVIVSRPARAASWLRQDALLGVMGLPTSSLGPVRGGRGARDADAVALRQREGEVAAPPRPISGRFDYLEPGCLCPRVNVVDPYTDLERHLCCVHRALTAP